MTTIERKIVNLTHELQKQVEAGNGIEEIMENAEQSTQKSNIVKPLSAVDRGSICIMPFRFGGSKIVPPLLFYLLRSCPRKPR